MEIALTSRGQSRQVRVRVQGLSAGVCSGGVVRVNPRHGRERSRGGHSRRSSKALSLVSFEKGLCFLLELFRARQGVGRVSPRQSTRRSPAAASASVAAVQDLLSHLWSASLSGKKLRALLHDVVSRSFGSNDKLSLLVRTLGHNHIQYPCRRNR